MADNDETQSRPPSREVHRHTFKIPFANTSVLEWWNEQHDPSASVRMLIRAEIQKHGYTDTLERRVEQGDEGADGDSES